MNSGLFKRLGMWLLKGVIEKVVRDMEDKGAKPQP